MLDDGPWKALASFTTARKARPKASLLDKGQVMRFVFNAVLAGLLVAGFAELSRRYTFVSALLMSVPLTSVIALSFVYVETGDIERVSELSMGIFWLVVPSLAFFLILPILLKNGLNYWLSLGVSIMALTVIYYGYSAVLKRFGISA
jgi:uncharacterized membrane protein (GlpM family)